VKGHPLHRKVDEPAGVKRPKDTALASSVTAGSMRTPVSKHQDILCRCPQLVSAAPELAQSVTVPPATYLFAHRSFRRLNMVGPRFDVVSRSISTRLSRRTGVAALASGLLAALPLALGSEHVEAKRKKGKKEKKYKFTANPMSGDQEVPALSGDLIGLGNASFTIKGKQICGIFNLSQATSFTVTGTHIHTGAAGVEGGIVVDFGATVGSKVCQKPGSILKQIRANPAGFYANIHTDMFPNGAVRGQLQKV
jgi:hypothetical protein